MRLSDSTTSRRWFCLSSSLVGRQGFEPWTLGLKVRCSDQTELPARGAYAAFLRKRHRYNHTRFADGCAGLLLGVELAPDQNPERPPVREAETARLPTFTIDQEGGWQREDPVVAGDTP